MAKSSYSTPSLGENMIRNILVLLLLSLSAFAGDDASGDVPRKMDLSVEYTPYEMKETDRNWSQSLVSNFKYKGKVVHFVKTNIPLVSNKETIEGRIYQSVENPDVFYVAEGDLMFKIGNQHPYSPGVGGFSMHAPKSKNFIVCLNCLQGGVPALKSSKVIKGIVNWQGTKWSRL